MFTYYQLHYYNVSLTLIYQIWQKKIRMFTSMYGIKFVTVAFAALGVWGLF